MGVINSLISTAHLKHLRASHYQKVNEKVMSHRYFSLVQTLTLDQLQKNWKLTFPLQTEAESPVHASLP